MPRLRIVQLHRYESDGGTSVVVLLRVTNPTLGAVRLRLTKSSYEGEANTWNDEEEASTTLMLNGLLVDSLTQTVLDVELKPGLTTHLKETDTVELLSAEDSILEMGVRASDMPESVRQWDPSTATGETCSLRHVATSASNAWFELRVRDTAKATLRATAVPIAFEVDVGNGSWESSLIEAKGEDDKVTFDIVLVWT